jgi:hypothetical protein
MKITFHCPDDLADALDEFVRKTHMKRSKVIMKALEYFVINHAHRTIPEMAAKVQVEKRLRDWRTYGSYLRLLKSTGYGTNNLIRTMKDIEGMPLSREDKKILSEQASLFNEFKKSLSKDGTEILKAALPNVLQPKSKVAKLWKTSFCRGCSYVLKDEKFCEKYCKKLSILRR